jgi:hypothetical protein
MVKFTETESRMVVSKNWTGKKGKKGGEGELLFNGCRVSP